MFPSMDNAVTHYGSIDYNTLRLTTTANTVLIFTYIDGKNWGIADRTAVQGVHERNAMKTAPLMK